MVFPLPYYVLVVALGGGNVAAGIGTMSIAAVATGVAVGRRVRRGLIGSISAWAVGLLILAGMAVFTPDAPLLAYQVIPAITAMCLVGLILFLLARRGAPKRVLERKIEPLAAGQVWPRCRWCWWSRSRYLSFGCPRSASRPRPSSMACVSTPRSPRRPAGRSMTPRSTRG